MRVTLQELLQKLGVGYVMAAYETFPWSVSDSTTGKTCSAEVRMNPEGNEVEAEIQIFYDNPEPGKGSIEQILWLRAMPHAQEKWDVDDLKIKGTSWVNKIYGWEEKCCNFFRACILEIEQGKMPDIDALLEKEMREDERFGGGKGSAGKAPKIRPQQLLNMKQGGSF